MEQPYTIRDRRPDEVDDTARLQESVAAGQVIPGGTYFISKPIQHPTG